MTQPFVVRIGSVSVFPKTSVVYLELLSGQEQLEKLHNELSGGALAFDEPFPFHPHITLAQNFAPETVGERLQMAQNHWASYRGPREFLLDRVVFVQNTANNCWLDLRSFDLQGMPAGPGMQPAPQLTQTY